MRGMSESSLPPFGPARKPRALPGFGPRRPVSLLRRLRARLDDTLRRVPRGIRKRRGEVEDVTEGTRPELESRARDLIRGYLDAQAANLERAQRLGMKANRLEEAGTPSESARNRAERARREVSAGLGVLRVRFVEATREGDGAGESARAFDRVVEVLCPAFEPGRTSEGS